MLDLPWKVCHLASSANEKKTSVFTHIPSPHSNHIHSFIHPSIPSPPTFASSSNPVRSTRFADTAPIYKYTLQDERREEKRRKYMKPNLFTLHGRM